MSKFSDYLADCVHNSHLNVSQLAKLAGFSRTHLQKILIGERFINNEEQFIGILEELNLPWEKEQELRKLYKIEQLGEKHYEQMLCVLEFIKKFQKAQPVQPISTNITAQVASKGTFPVQGQSSVLYYLQNALNNVKAKPSQEQQIYLIAQNTPILFETIASQLYGLHTIHLEHIIYYQAANENKEYQIKNLIISKNILPLILANMHYMPMAIYQGHLEHQIAQSLLPGLYIDDNIIINFQENFARALISFDKEIISFYKNLFFEQKRKAKPLIHTYENTNFFLPYANGLTQHNKNDIQYFLIYGPCLLKYMNTKQLLSYVHKEYLEDTSFMQSLFHYAETLAQMPCAINYYTKQGVLRFMEDGRDLQIPTFLIEPVTMEERIEVLKALMQQNTNTNRSDYLLKEDYFSYESALSISCYSPTSIIFYFGEGDEENTFFFHENSFNNSIHDFLSNLMQTDLVYSYEETKAFLEEVLQQYTQKISHS